MSRADTPGTTFISKKPFLQWDGLMKTYYKKHEEKCSFFSDTPVDQVLDRNEEKLYPTGSSYKGAVGMNGYGEYTYPNGVVYRGDFYDGCFHGNGELVFNHGPEAHSVVRGQWVNGVLTEHKILLDGKLEYDTHDWMYCSLRDRRYMVEFEKDLHPDGIPLITPDHPPRTIPPGYYDTEDGLYKPLTKLVYDHDTLMDVNRAPSVGERKWIRDNCRKEPMGVVGPRPDLYEKWVDPVVEPSPPPKPLVGFHESESRNPSTVSQETVDLEFHPVIYDSSQVQMYMRGTRPPSSINLKYKK